jgi:predicted acetyltransferase
MEEFRAIKQSEMEECLDMWGIVFERVGRQYFVPYFEGDPWFKRAYTRVCVVDGKIASAVQICERKVRVGEAELVMGGIGSVGTYAEYRGRGYSSRLMLDTVRVMKRHGMDFSVLFTGIQPFYEKALWRSVPQKYISAEVGSFKTDADSYNIRALDWDTDLPDLKVIYESFNEGRPLTTIRTDEYWGGYGRARFCEPTLVAESGGKGVGYIHFAYDEPNCWPREIGYLPGHEGCAGPLIQKMIARCPDMEKLIVNFPHEPVIMDAINGIAKEVEIREPMGGMFRIINIRSLGERLLPELNRRRAPDGSISLDTEIGSLRLAVDKGKVSLGAENPIRIPLSQLEFFCLVFGIKSVEELGLTLPERAKDILEALFPPQKPVFWLADHF